MSHKVKWTLIELPIIMALTFVILPLNEPRYYLAILLIVGIAVTNYMEGYEHPDRITKRYYNIDVTAHEIEHHES